LDFSVGRDAVEVFSFARIFLGNQQKRTFNLVVTLFERFSSVDLGKLGPTMRKKPGKGNVDQHFSSPRTFLVDRTTGGGNSACTEWFWILHGTIKNAHAYTHTLTPIL
jgi:hypothetical protein